MNETFGRWIVAKAKFYQQCQWQKKKKKKKKKKKIVVVIVVVVVAVAAVVVVAVVEAENYITHTQFI